MLHNIIMNKNEILRSYGTEYKNMTIRLLEAADLAGDIKSRCSAKDYGALIGIKPNLVAPTPASFGATTHPEVTAGIIEYLKDNDFTNIVVLEGSWVGDRTPEAFEYCGYNAIAAEYGIRLIDTQQDETVKTDCSGMDIHICRSALELDYLINVPVLKGHCQTRMTCALKNMKGVIPNREKRLFHTKGLHKPIAHLNTGVHQDFIVIDHICGDPYFEEGGSPLTRNCVMAAKDPVLCDAFACSVLGLEPQDVDYIMIAEKLGVGSSDLDKLKLITLEEDNSESFTPLSNHIEISYDVEQLDSCSACFAQLTAALKRLDSEGLLDKLDDKICIGQGFKGKKGHLGVGLCTGKFDHSVPGCPPDADAIYLYMKKYIQS